MEEKVGQDRDLFLVVIHSVLPALFVGALSTDSLGGAKSMYYVRTCGFPYTLRNKMATQRGQSVIKFTELLDPIKLS